MMLRTMFIAIALWATVNTAVYAEIYTWTDNKGTVHFTEDASKVPPEFRKNIQNGDELRVPPAEAAPAPPDVAEEGQAPTTVKDTDPDATALVGGKSRNQWQQELEQSEAAMTTVRNRLAELSALAAKAPAKDEHKKLLAEYQELLAQYNEMKAGYFRLVEAARKAGFKVNLQQ